MSYHLDRGNIGRADQYEAGWRRADIDDLERVAVGASEYPWSGIQWAGGRRLGANFQRALFCVLDFDAPDFSLAHAIKYVFADYQNIIGPTRSHQKSKPTRGGKLLPPCDRFRVVLRFERVIDDLATYTFNMSHYINEWGADTSGKDGARFFWPMAAPHVELHGDCLPVLRAPKPRAKKAFDGEVGVIPRWVRHKLRFGCEDLTRNNNCYAIARELYPLGYSDADIVDMLMKSPIPIGHYVRDEVAQAVRNGCKAAEREMRCGETEEAR